MSESAKPAAPFSGRDMSVSSPMIVAPRVRDLAELSRELEAWLGTKLPGATQIKVKDLTYPLGAGMSHETILFDAEWDQAGTQKQQGMVVRIKPMGSEVYLDDMYVEQYKLIELMHQTKAVPVAEPLWMESNPDLLGAPFFVMQRMYGKVAVSFPPYTKQGWLFDAAAQDRHTVWHDSVRCLAGIQTVPIAQAQFLAGSGKFATGLDQEIDRWQRFLDWADPKRELTFLRDNWARLQAARPANQPDGIVWGDARLGNMMVGPDFKVVAVMDWEQPSLGGALHDLGWWLYTERMQTIGRGLPALEGMGTREESLALWSETCGKSTADIEWYEAFAALKMECLSARMSSAGTMPANPNAPKPGTMLGQMLELVAGA